MIKRASVYLFLMALSVPVAGWFAFGPLIGQPLAVLTWPAERLLYHLNPSAGSNPSFDVLFVTVTGSLIWFCAALVVDFGVAGISHRIRHGRREPRA